jgi:F-type H+-transporting ATPase subunit alpha
MEAKYSGVFDSIRESKKIDSETEEDLKKALDDFKTSFAG